MNTKTIAVLTSGGDAPGMNAAIRAVVRTALADGLRVLGIRRGYNGLLNGDVIDMNLRSVSDIIHHGGTMLYTARSPEFNTPAGVKKAANMAAQMNIPVLGIVENYSYVKCPDCGKEIRIFGESHIDETAGEMGIPVLGKMPIDADLAAKVEDEKFYEAENPYLDEEKIITCFENTK